MVSVFVKTEYKANKEQLQDLIIDSPALPAFHPNNELDIPELDLSTEYNTCILFISGYIRSYTNMNTMNITKRTIQFVSKIIENFSFKSLRIKSNETLELYPKTEYMYNYIIIEENGILTSRNQGILGIHCFDMILKNHSKIHLNAKGFKGGLPGCQGVSYLGNLGIFTSSNKSNYGGGGGGVLFGGGGGYGSKGQNGDERYMYKSGDGGLIYGDNKELDYSGDFDHFVMGSGGGGGYNDGHKKIGNLKLNKNLSQYSNQNININLANISKGGNGGGALFLNIFGYLQLNNNSSIQCDGEDGYNALECGGGGGGSGGSILIGLHKYDNLIMNGNSKIQCIGGAGATKQCGNGGYGRIRIKNYKWNQIFNKGIHKNINLINIKPKPLVG